MQCAVETKYHLIVAHEVTNAVHDRHQLSSMARQAKEVPGAEAIEALAGRGYYDGKETKTAFSHSLGRDRPFWLFPRMPHIWGMSSRSGWNNTSASKRRKPALSQNRYRCSEGRSAI